MGQKILDASRINLMINSIQFTNGTTTFLVDGSVGQSCWQAKRGRWGGSARDPRGQNSKFQAERVSTYVSRQWKTQTCVDVCVWRVFVAVGHRLHGEDQFARAVKLPRFKGRGSFAPWIETRRLVEHVSINAVFCGPPFASQRRERFD